MTDFNNADKSQIINLVMAMWIFEHRLKHFNANGRSIEQMYKVISEIVEGTYFK